MAAQPSAIRRATIALAWRPEWPIVVIVALAWVALAVTHTSSSHQGAHAAHGSNTSALAVIGAAIGGWTLMSVAMMVPVTLPAVRHVGLNSIRRRRWWAMAVYVASYLAVWVVFGVVALGLVWALSSTGPWSTDPWSTGPWSTGPWSTGLDDHQLVVGALAIATGWQLTKWKRRAVVACQRTVPLPPTGWRADYGCAHFGARQAGRCVISCWSLMLLMAVVGHGNLVIMAALTAGIVAERRAWAGKRLIVLLGGALAVATVGTVLFG
ncbi:MAG: DUF2182 domain-containing protein [Pseudonocardiaceae bacterium]